MDKKDRLLQLIEHFSQGNKSQFAKMLGVTPQAITTWIARNTFDTDMIYANCFSISPHWLLTGEGEMLTTSANSTLQSNNSASFTELLAMINDLQKRNESLSMQLGAAQERIRQLEETKGVESVHAEELAPAAVG